MNLPNFIKENDKLFKLGVDSVINVYNIKKQIYTFPDIFIYDSKYSIIDTTILANLVDIKLTNSFSYPTTSIIIPAYLLDKSIHKLNDVNSNEMFIFELSMPFNVKVIPLIDKISECRKNKSKCFVGKIEKDLFKHFPISEIRSKILKVWSKYSKMSKKDKIKSVLQNFLFGCVINMMDNTKRHYSEITSDLLMEFDIIKNDPMYIGASLSGEKIISSIVEI